MPRPLIIKAPEPLATKIGNSLHKYDFKIKREHPDKQYCEILLEIDEDGQQMKHEMGHFAPDEALRNVLTLFWIYYKRVFK